ncbi:MAG: M67 family metallopeptidase [Acidimicrobiales bacterium]|nr:M67 family metallopeptidase [Acidimicrobiales bacterium]MDP7411710.1 M67 family metallopeptidase [Acidimicrobiales bacterium]MEE1570560.1 M67 family metallopeptidase [Acidimicrobiales bacterium]
MSEESLTLTPDVHRAMINLALDHVPYESCGLFAGPPGSMYVDTFFPIENVAPPERRREIYTLDGVGQLDAEKSADAAGSSILGVMHSHTHTLAYPSPTDVADAARFDEFGVWVFLIVSLEHPEPYMRAFRIRDAVIKEVPVAVEPD